MKWTCVAVACLIFVIFCTNESKLATNEKPVQKAMTALGYETLPPMKAFLRTPNYCFERTVCDEKRGYRYLLPSPSNLKEPKIYIQRMNCTGDWYVRLACVEALTLWIYIKGGQYSPEVVHIIPPLRRLRKLEGNKRVRKALDWCVRRGIKRAKKKRAKTNWFGYCLRSTEQSLR